MNPAGVSESGPIRLDFDRHLMVQFHGFLVTSDAGCRHAADPPPVPLITN